MEVLKNCFDMCVNIMQITVSLFGYRVNVFGLFCYTCIGFLLLFAFFRLLK